MKLGSLILGHSGQRVHAVAYYKSATDWGVTSDDLWFQIKEQSTKRSLRLIKIVDKIEKSSYDQETNPK